jgi:hypothetical protein
VVLVRSRDILQLCKALTRNGRAGKESIGFKGILENWHEWKACLLLREWILITRHDVNIEESGWMERIIESVLEFPGHG